jgi:hypothetical protein
MVKGARKLPARRASAGSARGQPAHGHSKNAGFNGGPRELH